MGELPHARSFRDLIVYRKARQLAQEIFEYTKAFPKEERYSLTDQIRRSSRSVGAQIAEAWAKRRYEAHFISKLTDADAECQETSHWIETARDCGYLTPEQSAVLLAKCEEIGRLLAGMMAKSSLFCGTPTYTVREETAEYFITTDY
ncbi:MAG: four helix bundle protein [Anaerolineae bacterium]|nr:MAG: four helix bundle protein [Anaerolineae bacterium]